MTTWGPITVKPWYRSRTIIAAIAAALLAGGNALTGAVEDPAALSWTGIGFAVLMAALRVVTRGPIEP